MKSLRKENIKLSEYMGLIICLCIFMATLLFAGVGYYPDSYSYEWMSTIREPLYPLFLFVVRSVFGKQIYQNIIIFLQNVFAAFVVWHVAGYLKKLFSLKRIGEILVYACLLSPYFISAIFSRTHLFLTNSILTEGITVSLWLLFAKRLMQCAFEENNKNLFYLIVYSIVMSLIRSQMQITILLIAVVVLVKAIIRKESKKVIVFVVFQVLGAFAMVFLFTHMYFFVLNGNFMSNTYGPQTKFSNVMYLAEEEDLELFEDEEIRLVFESAYQKAIEGKYNKKYVSKGLLARARAVENSHDPIKAECLAPALDVHNERLGITDDLEKALENDRVASEIREKLLKEHFLEWCYDYIALAIYGFIRSIAIVNKWINWCALLLYILAILLVVIAFKLDKKSKAAVFMLITLLCICANVFATSLYIMCLSRYMIYNLPFFYIGGLVLLKEIRSKSERKQ